MDESHQMLPQIRGQFAADKSRKGALVENGFRLPTAYDNRPLTFEEFERIDARTLYLSATPGDYELEVSDNLLKHSTEVMFFIFESFLCTYVILLNSLLFSI